MVDTTFTTTNTYSIFRISDFFHLKLNIPQVHTPVTSMKVPGNIALMYQSLGHRITTHEKNTAEDLLWRADSFTALIISQF